MRKVEEPYFKSTCFCLNFHWIFGEITVEARRVVLLYISLIELNYIHAGQIS